MDSSPSGSFIHGILQARILEWVAITFSRESSRPRDPTQVSCIAGRFFTVYEPPRMPNHTPWWKAGALIVPLISKCTFLPPHFYTGDFLLGNSFPLTSLILGSKIRSSLISSIRLPDSDFRNHLSPEAPIVYNTQTHVCAYTHTHTSHLYIYIVLNSLSLSLSHTHTHTHTHTLSYIDISLLGPA